MSRTTTLAPSLRSAPAAVPIRPSDRLAASMPRHALGVIPILPRRDTIAIEVEVEPASTTSTTSAIEPSDDDLAALEYSSELL